MINYFPKQNQQDGEHFSWPLFYSILMVFLSLIRMKTGQKRNEWVDLVWFTWGGKTEAYLGLIAPYNYKSQKAS